MSASPGGGGVPAGSAAESPLVGVPAAPGAAALVAARRRVGDLAPVGRRGVGRRCRRGCRDTPAVVRGRPRRARARRDDAIGRCPARRRARPARTVRGVGHARRRPATGRAGDTGDPPDRRRALRVVGARPREPASCRPVAGRRRRLGARRANRRSTRIVSTGSRGSTSSGSSSPRASATVGTGGRSQWHRTGCACWSSEATDVLPDDDAALARGLIIGDDTDQPPDMLERFRASGLAHLTAVSGQNVNFVMAAAGPMLRRLRPMPRLAASLALIGWFVVVDPGGAVRAARRGDGGVGDGGVRVRSGAGAAPPARRRGHRSAADRPAARDIGRVLAVGRRDRRRHRAGVATGPPAWLRRAARRCRLPSR